MKNRLSILLLTTSMVLTLCSCGNQIPEMTDEEMNAIGEYAAITLLKYDANYRSRLVDLSDYDYDDGNDDEYVQEEEYPNEEPAADSSDTEQPVSQPEVEIEVLPEQEFSSIEEFMELPVGVTVSYESVHICDSYPEDDASGAYFYLEATGDKKLLVLKFCVTNQSAQEQYLDFLHSGNIYKIKVDGSFTRSALTTMLEDDMVSYMGTLQPGSSKELVLLFEVDKQYADAEKNMELTMRNDETIYTIQAN